MDKKELLIMKILTFLVSALLLLSALIGGVTSPTLAVVLVLPAMVWSGWAITEKLFPASGKN